MVTKRDKISKLLPARLHLSTQGGALDDAPYRSTHRCICFSVSVRTSQRSNDRRYLLCPAYVTVSILKKFLRGKFELTPKHHVRS